MAPPQPDDETSQESLAAAAVKMDAQSMFGGRYSSVTKIGAGGMGAVYRAEDTVLNRIVALKVLLPNLQADAMIRFHNEAKTTAKLSHKNILNVLDFGLSETGEAYLVMDYLDGKSLADLLKDSGPLESSVAIPIFCQICLGLQHAHSLGVLHRDIKPSNIMIVYDERGSMQVKVVDFGLAKMERAEQSLTTTGARVGSPLYMSPEQCNGQSVDHRSDIYSLGVLMYKTLTGVVPFHGDSFLETLSKHVHEEPKDINENDRHLQFPSELSAIISKTLDKDPDRRYQSCEELRQALFALEQATLGRSRDEANDRTPSATVSDTTIKNSQATLLLWCLALTGLCLTVVAGFVVFKFEDLNKHDVVQVKAHESSTLGLLLGKQVSEFREDGNIWIAAHPPSGDETMEWLQNQFPKCRHFSFTNANVTGAKLPPFVRRKLEGLDLSNTFVDDQAISTIAKMKTLEGLWLNADAISDAGIGHLEGLTKLKELGLRSTLITNESLNTISRLPALDILDISNCDNLSSDALATIEKMRSLKTLQIANCKNIPVSDILKFQSKSDIRVVLDGQPMHASRPGWGKGMFWQRRDKRELSVVLLAEVKGDEPLFEHGSRQDMTEIDVRNQSWKDFHDPECREFFRIPSNWDLTKEQAKKLKNPRIRKYFEDPRFSALLKDPEIRSTWRDPKAQSELRKFEDTLKKFVGPEGE